MALMTVDQKERVARQFMRKNRDMCLFGRGDLMAAIDARDQYIEDTKTAANSSLPQPFRREANTEQKAGLEILILEERFVGGNN